MILIRHAFILIISNVFLHCKLKFLEVILVANIENYSKISELLKNDSLPPLPNLKIDLIKVEDVDEDDSEEWGTADVLRHISEKFNRNASF